MKHRLPIPASAVIVPLFGDPMPAGSLSAALRRVGVSSTNYSFEFNGSHSFIRFRFKKHFSAISRILKSRK